MSHLKFHKNQPEFAIKITLQNPTILDFSILFPKNFLPRFPLNNTSSETSPSPAATNNDLTVSNCILSNHRIPEIDTKPQ